MEMKFPSERQTIPPAPLQASRSAGEAWGFPFRKIRLILAVTILALAAVWAGWEALNRWDYWRYGEHVQRPSVRVHYKGSVTEAEATRLAEYLSLTCPFGKKDMWFQLRREGDTLQLWVTFARPGQANDPALIAYYRDVCGLVSHEVFADQPVEAHLCDGSFQPLQVIRSSWSDLATKYGKPLPFRNRFLFYAETVTEAEARRAIDELNRPAMLHYCQNALIQLSRTKETVQVRIVLAKEALSVLYLQSSGQTVWRTLTKEVFKAQKVEVHFCDNQPQTRELITKDR